MKWPAWQCLDTARSGDQGAGLTSLWEEGGGRVRPGPVDHSPVTTRVIWSVRRGCTGTPGDQNSRITIKSLTVWRWTYYMVIKTSEGPSLEVCRWPICDIWCRLLIAYCLYDSVIWEAEYRVSIKFSLHSPFQSLRSWLFDIKYLLFVFLFIKISMACWQRDH